MIRVRRSEPPPRLLAADIDAARQEVENTPGAYLRPLWNSPEVADALRQDFQNKCVWCESLFSEDRTHRVMHFRPPRNTVGDNGRLRHRHYEWLAYDWDNLYSACAFCISHRGTRFPVAGPRAAPGHRGDKLLAEHALIIDPCVVDPATVLVQHSNGRLVSSDAGGLATIEAFDLNRSHLVSQRRKVVEELRVEWDQHMDGELDQNDFTEWLSHHTSPRRAFSGQRRQILRLWASRQSNEVEAIMAQIAPVAEASPWSPGDVQAAEETYEELAGRRQKYSLRAPSDKKPTLWERVFRSATSAVTEWLGDLEVEGYFERSHTITRVDLENIRSFESISFEIPRADDMRAPWTMFLGENATGKSTIMQATAACLAGANHPVVQSLNPMDFLRDGANEGLVRVHLSGPSRPLEMRVLKNESRFRFSEPEPKVLVLGYGATRLLPRGSQQGEEWTVGYARVTNLFDPFVATIDAASWLLAQPADTFNRIGNALELALDLPQEATFVRDDQMQTVSLQAFGSTVQLRHLSDGYQSIIGTVVDIISVLLTRWESTDIAEGIVLIDELGSHLHPQWKTRIVYGLRSALPRVQFLVTTHDPLCIHGIAPREIVILERDDVGTITTVNELESIDEMTIDQVLRTRLFKLNTTRGIAAVENYERAATLLRQRSDGDLTVSESEELSALLERLGGPIYVEKSRPDTPADEELESWVTSSNPAVAYLDKIWEEEE